MNTLIIIVYTLAQLQFAFLEAPNGSEIHLVSPVLLTDSIDLDLGDAEDMLINFKFMSVHIGEDDNCGMCHIVNAGEIKDGPKPVR